MNKQIWVVIYSTLSRHRTTMSSLHSMSPSHLTKTKSFLKFYIAFTENYVHWRFLETCIGTWGKYNQVQKISICKLSYVRWLRHVELLRDRYWHARHGNWLDEACSWFIFETWPMSLLRPTRQPCRTTPQPSSQHHFQSRCIVCNSSSAVQ